MCQLQLIPSHKLPPTAVCVGFTSTGKRVWDVRAGHNASLHGWDEEVKGRHADFTREEHMEAAGLFETLSQGEGADWHFLVGCVNQHVWFARELPRAA